MFKVNGGVCEITGSAVTLMSEVTFLMRRLRTLDSEIFDDDCFNMCIRLSGMTEEEIDKEASEVRKKVDDELKKLLDKLNDVVE